MQSYDQGAPKQCPNPKRDSNSPADSYKPPSQAAHASPSSWTTDSAGSLVKFEESH